MEWVQYIVHSGTKFYHAASITRNYIASVRELVQMLLPLLFVSVLFLFNDLTRTETLAYQTTDSVPVRRLRLQ